MDNHTASKVIAKILAGGVRATLVLEKNAQVIRGITTGVETVDGHTCIRMVDLKSRRWLVDPRGLVQATIEGEMFP